MSENKKVYQVIAENVMRYKFYKNQENDFQKKLLSSTLDCIKQLEDNYLPHGSGFNSGCKIDLESSSLDKIVITSSFHEMDENGFYDGWFDFTCTLTPSFLNGFNIDTEGENNDGDILSYVTEIICQSLDSACLIEYEIK